MGRHDEAAGKAFDEASKLTEGDQVSLGEWFLAEIESERERDRLFARSQDLLTRLAKQALEDRRRGLTEEIDPDVGSPNRVTRSGE